jgi:small multidrug resistance family-3 protein
VVKLYLFTGCGSLRYTCNAQNIKQGGIVDILRSVILFVLAGLAEIGGGWLVWQWLRSGWGISWGLLGGCILFLYGVLPTLQTEPAFGRVYAAYGGVFIALSLLWGWRVDGWQPDRFDLLGAALALVGVAVMMWGRNAWA